jgi:hypothetical protein
MKRHNKYSNLTPTIQPMYPVTMEILRSRHGLLVQYVSGETVILDADVTYLDDCLDCLDHWSGPANEFQSYFVRMLEKELLMLIGSNCPDDLLEGFVMTQKEKIKLASTEKGATQLCEAWRINRAATKDKLIRDFQLVRSKQIHRNVIRATCG